MKIRSEEMWRMGKIILNPKISFAHDTIYQMTTNMIITKRFQEAIVGNCFFANQNYKVCDCWKNHLWYCKCEGVGSFFCCQILSHAPMAFLICLWLCDTANCLFVCTIYMGLAYILQYIEQSLHFKSFEWDEGFWWAEPQLCPVM